MKLTSDASLLKETLQDHQSVIGNDNLDLNFENNHHQSFRLLGVQGRQRHLQ